MTPLVTKTTATSAYTRVEFLIFVLFPGTNTYKHPHPDAHTHICTTRTGMGPCKNSPAALYLGTHTHTHMHNYTLSIHFCTLLWSLCGRQRKEGKTWEGETWITSSSSVYSWFKSPPLPNPRLERRKHNKANPWSRSLIWCKNKYTWMIHKYHIMFPASLSCLAAPAGSSSSSCWLPLTLKTLWQ